ncbi:Uncharacterized protein DBV15_09788 [Temnothorax longispinosus]|uniref:Uncharacterized protein n=1 Tax=Temnothorax longispinosus TaxID=300112 RepID=A0A4S2JRE4_9HYME|nr:Uncharacterized protein DBV15_09788 [Temnothorax longispinosus]
MAVVVARKRHSIRRLVGKRAIVRKASPIPPYCCCCCTPFSRGETRESIRQSTREKMHSNTTPDDDDDDDVDVDVSCRAAVSHHHQLPRDSRKSLKVRELD